MNVLILILLLVCIGLPLWYAWRVWRLDEQTRAGWWAVVVEAGVIVLFVLTVGRWDIAGYYTRAVLLAVLMAAIIASWRRHAHRPWRAPDQHLWRSRWPSFLSVIVLGAGLVYIGAGLLVGGEARPLALPFAEGRFMVVQGGASQLLNHHHSHRAQRYAADIVAVNRAGFRAAGLYASEPARYVIYDVPVTSPCEGEVVAVMDGLPDLAPPESDAQNPAGNHVVIKCDGMLVELAHLRQGSVAVKTGDRLVVGEQIATVGNSGNTTEPHLHIHAVDIVRGAGIPIMFDGVIPVRNRMFRR